MLAAAVLHESTAIAALLGSLGGELARRECGHVLSLMMCVSHAVQQLIAFGAVWVPLCHTGFFYQVHCSCEQSSLGTESQEDAEHERDHAHPSEWPHITDLFCCESVTVAFYAHNLFSGIRSVRPDVHPECELSGPIWR